MTMQSVLNSLTDSVDIRLAITETVRIFFGYEPREVSALHCLIHLRSNRIVSIVDGSGASKNNWMASAGLQRVAEALRDEILRMGGIVVLDSPVRRLRSRRRSHPGLGQVEGQGQGHVGTLQQCAPQAALSTAPVSSCSPSRQARRRRYPSGPPRAYARGGTSTNSSFVRHPFW